MPLFTNGEWFQTYTNNELIQINGILRSGILTGASMLADVRIIENPIQEPGVDDSNEKAEQPSEEQESKEQQEQMIDREDEINELLCENFDNKEI